MLPEVVRRPLSQKAYLVRCDDEFYLFVRDDLTETEIELYAALIQQNQDLLPQLE